MEIQLERRDLLEVTSTLVRRRWVIYLAVVAVGIVALVGSFLTTPLYRATTTLQIERHTPDILTFRDLASADPAWGAYSDFYETQYAILSSEVVARTAAERMELVNHPGFSVGEGEPGLLARIRSLVPRKSALAEVDPLDLAANIVRGGLQISPVRNSQLVEISWISADPELAAKIANGVADAYIHLNIASKYSTNEQAEEFLFNQIHGLKDEIAGIEARLQEYGRSKGIVSIEETNNVTLQALQDIAGESTEAHTDLARAKARYEAVLDSSPSALPEVMNSSLIARLREEYAGYEAQYSEDSRLFKEDWPELRTLASRLEQSRVRLELETERIAEQVRASSEAEYQRALNSVVNLDNLLESQEEAALGLKRDAVEYENLESEVEKKREAMNALLTRRNEITLSGKLKDLDAKTSNVRIVETARPPTGPFRPNIKLNLVIGLLLGLALGAGLALFLDWVDNTIGSADELTRMIGLPLLAVIPKQTAAGASTPKPRRKQGAAAQASIELIAQVDGRAAASEAYRGLRTSLLLSHPGQPPRLIMATSAVPEEGKTTTLVNLAIVLAQLGRRVLIVDTDLRRPRLHKVFSVDNHQGISTYLSGLEDDPRPLIRSTLVENLDLLASGPIPPNPSELLNSDIFSAIGERLARLGYDHVLFDSPPALSVSDPLIIANSAEVRILVVRAGRTPRNLVRMAAEKLSQAASGTTGTVLNDLDPESFGSSLYKYQSVYTADEPVSKPPSQRAGGAGA